MKKKHRHLVAFAKWPRMGRVKTRLAKSIGAVWAWHFYHHHQTLLLHRLVAHPFCWNLWLAVSPDSASLMPRCWPWGWHLIKQGQGDIGARMMRTFRHLPVSTGPVVIIGTDVLGLGRAHIFQAFKLLETHDVVLGPAIDGGYYLIGMKRRPGFIPHVFENVRWSTPYTLEDTLNNLKSCQVAFLEPLADVDRFEDLPLSSATKSIFACIHTLILPSFFAIF